LSFRTDKQLGRIDESYLVVSSNGQIMNDYFLILVPLTLDGRDLSGIVFPEKGYVKSNIFKNNHDILLGIFGCLWGQSDDYLPQLNGLFAVVKVNDNIVPLDRNNQSVVKFKDGYVVFTGEKESCIQVIRADKNCPVS